MKTCKRGFCAQMSCRKKTIRMIKEGRLEMSSVVEGLVLWKNGVCRLVCAALVGASMELFMIKTGFYDKVTVIELEKRAWESSAEAQAVREALNPWRNHDAEARKN